MMSNIETDSMVKNRVDREIVQGMKVETVPFQPSADVFYSISH